MKRRVGILELTSLPRTSGWGLFWNAVFAPRYMSVMSQAVAAWLRRAGHEVHYRVYAGSGVPHGMVPKDLDFLFLPCTSRLATLAEHVAGAYKADNRKTAIVACGPHTRGMESPLPWANVTMVGGHREMIENLVGGWEAGWSDSLLMNIECGEFDPDTLPSVRERADDIRSTFQRWTPRRFQLVPMLTSVGCPNHCEFCVEHDINYQRVSDDAVKADLQAASELFPGTIVAFHDPNFGVRAEDVLRWAIELETRNQYFAQVELRHLNGRVLDLMKRARMRYIGIGVESFRGFGRKTGTHGLKPPMKVRHVIDRFREAEESIPHLQAHMMTGLDGEDYDSWSMLKTFVWQTPGSWVNVNVACSFPGTPMRERMEVEGRVLPLPGEFYSTPFLSHKLNISAVHFYRELWAFYRSQLRAMHNRYYTTPPGRLFGQMVRLPFVKEAIVTLERILAEAKRSREIDLFHDGRTTTIPAIYQDYQQLWLGPYREAA